MSSTPKLKPPLNLLLSKPLSCSCLYDQTHAPRHPASDCQRHHRSPSTSQESARRTRLGRLGAAGHVGRGPCAAGARSSPAVVKPNSLFPGHLRGTSQAILLEVARLRRAPPPQPTAPRAASVASISFTTFSKLKVTKLLPFLSLHLSLQAHGH